jgi:hypothetical protein
MRIICRKVKEKKRKVVKRYSHKRIILKIIYEWSCAKYASF